jgi:hypothetical protein
MLCIQLYLCIRRASRETIRLRATGLEPKLALPAERSFHTFMSHAWSTGQDTAHVIVRRVQTLLPTIRVWLDVDCIEDVSSLAESVAQSSSMALLLTRGYFASKNCRKELYAALESGTPLILIHEADEGKGGAPLNEMVAECREHCTDLAPEGAEGGRAPVVDAVCAVFDPTLWTETSLLRRSSPAESEASREASRATPAEASRSSCLTQASRSAKCAAHAAARRVASSSSKHWRHSTERAPGATTKTRGEAQRPCPARPIPWVRVGEFQLISLKLVCLRVMQQLPLALPPRVRLDDASALLVPGEMGDTMHFGDSNVRLAFCPSNEGAQAVAEELAALQRRSRNRHSNTPPPSDAPRRHGSRRLQVAAAHQLRGAGCRGVCVAARHRLAANDAVHDAAARRGLPKFSIPAVLEPQQRAKALRRRQGRAAATPRTEARDAAAPSSRRGAPLLHH